MRRIRFWAIGIFSFVAAIFGTIFIPGSFLNRAISITACTVLSFNSTFCALNLGGASDRVMAATTPKVEIITPNIPIDFSDQQIIEINKANSKLAFEPDKTGHLGITGDALKQNKKLVKGEPLPLEFSPKAIKEINKANEETDGYWFSPIDFRRKQFDEPQNHFDDETLDTGSKRLKDLKDDIIAKLKRFDGAEARKYLGGALHTLQDFYSHSNWVELGNQGIDTRLGRQIINKPSKDFKPCPNDAGQLESGGLKQLTTGYFKIGFVPKGKCRHGFALDGINKDKPPSLPTRKTSSEEEEYQPQIAEAIYEKELVNYKRASEFHIKAKALATEASVDYVNQILEANGIKNNIKAIKALMGMDSNGDPETCHAKPEESTSKATVCPAPKKSALSSGDPHLVTFDDFRYSFQTVGEFIATKSKDGKFQVQTRQSPVNRNLSMNSAVAMKVGKDKVALYSKDFPDGNTSTPLRVNGKPTVIQGNKLTLPGGGAIFKSGDTYTVDFPTGEKVLVASASAGGNAYFNVQPFVYNQANLYEGLLGNVNGNLNDELQVRGGQNLSVSKSTYGDVKQLLNGTIGLKIPGQLDVAEKLYFDQVNKEFGNSWRVKPEESLFNYPSGKTTKNFTDKSFPEKYLKLDMLSSQQLDRARKECGERKLTVDLMEACVFDVGFSGFSEFAYTTAQVNGYVDIINNVIPGVNLPKIPKAEEFIMPPARDLIPKICIPVLGCTKSSDAEKEQ